MKTVCSAISCNKKVIARQLCSAHYYHWYKTNSPEKFKEYKRKHRYLPSERYYSYKSKLRNDLRGWTLTLEDYKQLIEHPCYYCEDKFEQRKTGVGLDRIDNSIGYHLGNLISCCGVCNKLKNSIFTQNEAKAAISAILKVRGL